MLWFLNMIWIKNGLDSDTVHKRVIHGLIFEKRRWLGHILFVPNGTLRVAFYQTHTSLLAGFFGLQFTTRSKVRLQIFEQI